MLFIFLQNINLCLQLIKTTVNFYVKQTSLADIEAVLDEKKFFRANRKYIVNAEYITKFRSIHKSKINIELLLPLNEEIIVSQENAAAFKKWISEI